MKVADFGTSRLLEKSHATTVIGSPPYMAPEQFQGRAVLASDIYSVGVILYQMLTGTLPYFSPNPAQIERLVAQGRCTPPKIRNTQIPREISDIVMKALAPELGDRYQRACGAPRRPRHRRRDRPQRHARWRTSASACKAREVPKRGFCWNCRKPLHARSEVCAFCGEKQ